MSPDSGCFSVTHELPSGAGLWCWIGMYGSDIVCAWKWKSPRTLGFSWFVLVGVAVGGHHVDVLQVSCFFLVPRRCLGNTSSLKVSQTHSRRNNKYTLRLLLVVANHTRVAPLAVPYRVATPRVSLLPRRSSNDILTVNLMLDRR